MIIPKTKIHWFAILLVLVGVIFGLLVLASRTHEARAEVAGSNCPGANSIAIDNVTTSGMPIYPGPHHIVLSVPPTLATAVQDVKFTLDGQTNLLGRGSRVGTSSYWDMTWYSEITPPGSHTIGAVVAMTSGSCVVPLIPAYVSGTSTVAGVLDVRANPLSFNELAGNSKDLSLNSGVMVGTARYDVTSWTVFTKMPTNLGVMSAVDNGSAFRFTAGALAGDGTINVTAHYGGMSRPMIIPVKVYIRATATSPTTAAVDTSTNTSGATTKAATSGTTSATAVPTSAAAATRSAIAAAQPAQITVASSPTSADADTPSKQCVLTKLSSQRYTEINSGSSRSTAAEFEALRQCFEVRAYILPTNLVPVPANKTTLQQRPVASDVSVAGISNPTEKSTTTEKVVLKFSGKAKPKATVLLYLFSEPLVVTTSADANGDWSYSLSDPMEPGKHEAYALVDKGDGNYERSSVFSFAIAKAQAAPANPKGYSLKIDRNVATAVDNTSPVKLYVGAVSGLIFLVIAVATYIVLRRRKPTVESIAESTAESTTQDSGMFTSSAPTQTASLAQPELPSQFIVPTQPLPPADTSPQIDGVRRP